MITFFRQNIAPFIVLLVFLVALLAVSARIFLPSDMIAPAPIESAPQSQIDRSSQVAGLPPTLKMLVQGVPTQPL